MRVLLAAAALGAVAADAANTPAPNLIFIMADDLGENRP
jgi:hypothetical protein